MSTTVTHVAPIRTHRLTLPRNVAFIGTTIAFGAFFLAAGAPTPLFVLLEQEWGFPPALLTIAFASYAIALLVALVVVGGLSDYVGRRPVLIGSLVVQVAAMLVFVFARDIEWIIAARVIQGIATGAATSAFTASVVELAPPARKRVGSIIGGAAPTGGLALGALLGGVAVQFVHAPVTLVFSILTIVMIVGLLVALFAGETVGAQHGAIRSLKPTITLPRVARREFGAIVPGLIGSWMLAALFLGLVPSVIRDIFQIDSGLLNGTTAFIEPGAAALASVLLGAVSPRRVNIFGGAAVAAGTLVILAGIGFGILPLVMVGGFVGGLGFGAGFSGSLRAVGPLALPHERAGLFAAVFLVAYLSFGVPAIIVGQLVAPLGLLATVMGFGAVIVIASLVGLAAQVRGARRPTIVD